jgi:recombination protein RecA
VRRIEAIKDGQSVLGNRVKVKVVKNKVAPPFKEAQFDILYNEGISKLGDLIDAGVDNNIIIKSGSWFSYNNERIGQGRDAVKKYLQENEKIAKEIDTVLRKKLGLLEENGHAKIPGKSDGNGAAPATQKAEPAPAKKPVKV